jgi:MFS family permease
LAQDLPNASRHHPQDILTAGILFAGLAALYALTRSQWLDDWDSVNLAFALDDFDLKRHWPHPPGYPIFVAAGKLAHLVIANHAAALTLVSSFAGAAVAAMFFVLDRRHNGWPVALCATLIMALSPLFWLQSGLALTDMFGMVFVLAFLLVDGTSPKTQESDFARRAACGLIAGLSLGARPHITLLIVAYWCLRGAWSGRSEARHVLTAMLAFLVGALAWLVPAALATGGFAAYLDATVGQFNWRFGRPGVSVLGAPISASYLLTRAVALVGWIGQAFAPMHLTASNVPMRTALAVLIVVFYVTFAWRSPSKDVARPYMIASAIYLAMLFILLPTRHLRYFLPFSLIVGWAVSGYLEVFRRPLVRAAALVLLCILTVLPSFFLVGGLRKAPPPVAALEWVRSNRPSAILYSDSLRRHADYYWREGETKPEPRTGDACDKFHRSLGSGRPVLATRPELCGIAGESVALFKRDARIHDKHSRIPVFEFGKRARTPG